MQIHTTHTRDAALRELHRINRWLITGSVVLTGVFAEAAANAFPGHTAKAASAGAKKKSRTDTRRSSKPLQPPAQVPQATGEPAKTSAPEPAQAQESPASRESGQVPESIPAQESSAAQEPAPAQESAPAHESAPAEEPAPVVSGGS